MSDPLDAFTGKTHKKFDAPGTARSVGWTVPEKVRLADEKNPLPLD